MKPETSSAEAAGVRSSGLLLPRAPYPGQPWTPRTPAEEHLLAEAQRLDRVRLVLLGDLGRLRHELGVRTARRQRMAAAQQRAGRLAGCPLNASELNVLQASATGEEMAATAARMKISEHAVGRHRQRAVEKLDAGGLAHAVALAVDAGWITAAPRTGVAP